MDQQGEWFDHVPGRFLADEGGDGQVVGDWRWYCGLQCLRSAAGEGSGPPDAVRGDTSVTTGGPVSSTPPGWESAAEPAPAPVDRQGPPRETGHSPAGAPPAAFQPPKRLVWADEVEDGVRFGDFPAAGVGP